MVSDSTRYCTTCPFPHECPKKHSDIPLLKKDVIVPESQNENTKFHLSEDSEVKNTHPPSESTELNFRKFFLPVLILLFLRN
jgi:hypothetical protein